MRSNTPDSKGGTIAEGRSERIMKILSKEDIPSELWRRNTLHMANFLVNSYESLLDEYNITQKALDLNDPGRVIGGQTLAKTLEYFARRFGVSSCRIESLILDPDGAFSTTSEDLVTIFSEGKIALLDIACGTGSVGASILSTFCVLRREQILPITPTSIHIIGGDCSNHALDIYNKLMKRLMKDLEMAGIDSHLEIVKWLAESSYGTSELFDLLFDKNPDADEYLVFIANFSGAMDRHFEEYKNSIQHIFDRTHNKRCAIIWVEPGGYSKAENVLTKLIKIANKTPWFRSNQVGLIRHDYEWFHPLQKRNLPCRVLLKAYSRRC